MKTHVSSPAVFSRQLNKGLKDVHLSLAECIYRCILSVQITPNKKVVIIMLQ